ncbi:hypothetical protein SAY86_011282 [Trapa natans]|uniref:Homeobox-leucine zipper protein ANTHOCYANINLESS 2 n=1 Tax=Trapa natans TaxID=22666 RepID=A0AAN7LLW0_TRANT|nr:hypothetical protein SAY86_011282 [Trapa natans]
MSLGGFLDSSSSCSSGGRMVVGGGGGIRFPYNSSSGEESSIINMPSGAIAQPRLVTAASSLVKPVFSSPGLSLALQTGFESHGDVGRLGSGNFEADAEVVGSMMNRRSRDAPDQDQGSRSGSDNMDGAASGDDQDAAEKPARKKRYHRHTPQQIQELEALFKECPHPDEKQRLELSQRLCLDPRQVKFWFQNRRTQMKTHLERHENSLLRQENNKLRSENMSLRNAVRTPICNNCGGPAIIGEISLEQQHLRIENARLRDELDRVSSLAGRFLDRLPNSSLELGMGGNGFGGLQAPLPDFGAACGIVCSSSVMAPPMRSAAVIPGVDRPEERSMLLELALSAMDELVKMVQANEPLWIRGLDGSGEILNRDEYLRTFPPCIGMKPSGFVAEASRVTGKVIINSLALVETLMDSSRWAEMFPGLIARASTVDVISSGMGGTRNGAVHLMHSELQVPSPLVPVREVTFLRFCKQHAEGLWSVVDVSVDVIRDSPSGPPSITSCRRLPSGCIIQDMPSGYSKVTWVEHAEYDESQIHELYRPLISSGMGFGAPRWVATLQRQCQCLAILMSPAPSSDHNVITGNGRRSMLKLAQRMTASFCAGVCASTVHKWNMLGAAAGAGDQDVRVMTRKSVDDPGDPSGVVLSASASVWVSVSPQRLFDFLRDERLRSEWDILSNGGPMHEMAHIAKGQDHGNCVSLLRAAGSGMDSSQSSMLILQETCADASGALVVYAPVDIPAMHVVMNGGDSSYLALLPSGFAIVPDGRAAVTAPRGGALLTVAFQILVNSLPTAKLTVESVNTVKNLISCTLQKIKAAAAVAAECES